jgi:hypothetical protein
VTIQLTDLDHATVNTATPGQVQATVNGQSSNQPLSVDGTVTVSGDQLSWQHT